MKTLLLVLYGITLTGLFFIGCINKEQATKMGTNFEIHTGVNVSHWLSQSKKRGEERRNYIVKADFDTIAAMGFDHVRLPVDEIQLWDDEGEKED